MSIVSIGVPKSSEVPPKNQGQISDESPRDRVVSVSSGTMGGCEYASGVASEVLSSREAAANLLLNEEELAAIREAKDSGNPDAAKKVYETCALRLGDTNDGLPEQYEHVAACLLCAGDIEKAIMSLELAAGIRKDAGEHAAAKKLRAELAELWLELAGSYKTEGNRTMTAECLSNSATCLVAVAEQHWNEANQLPILIEQAEKRGDDKSVFKLEIELVKQKLALVQQMDRPENYRLCCNHMSDMSRLLRHLAISGIGEDFVSEFIAETKKGDLIGVVPAYYLIGKMLKDIGKNFYVITETEKDDAIGADLDAMNKTFYVFSYSSALEYAKKNAWEINTAEWDIKAAEEDIRVAGQFARAMRLSEESAEFSKTDDSVGEKYVERRLFAAEQHSNSANQNKMAAGVFLHLAEKAKIDGDAKLSGEYCTKAKEQYFEAVFQLSEAAKVFSELGQEYSSLADKCSAKAKEQRQLEDELILTGDDIPSQKKCGNLAHARWGLFEECSAEAERYYSDARRQFMKASDVFESVSKFLLSSVLSPFSFAGEMQPDERKLYFEYMAKEEEMRKLTAEMWELAAEVRSKANHIFS